MTLLHRIVSLVLIPFVIASTMGINIYTHHCGCCNRHDIALVSFENCCEQSSSNGACSVNLTNDHTSCCGAAQPLHPTTQHECKKDGCCTFGHHFLKINTETPVNSQKIVDSRSEISLHILSSILIFADFDSFVTRYENHSGQSPPRPGKFLLVQLHQLKISPDTHMS